MAGYHIQSIPKGVLGQYSKVVEEFMEFSDAVEQDCSIMAMIELSDMIGAIKCYFYENDRKPQWEQLITNLIKHTTNLPVDYFDLQEAFELTLLTSDPAHWSRITTLVNEIVQYVSLYNLGVRDLIRMNYITERAFINGERN